MDQIIKSHNTKILSQIDADKDKARSCNCRIKNECPMDGNCLVKDIVYEAVVTTDKETVSYIGLASGGFKSRFGNHKKSFKFKKYKHETELSKYVWRRKIANERFEIRWKVISKSNTQRRSSGQCNLCLEEKYQIARKRKNNNGIRLINRRNEFISKCRHRK